MCGVGLDESLTPAQLYSVHSKQLDEKEKEEKIEKGQMRCQLV